MKHNQAVPQFVKELEKADIFLSQTQKKQLIIYYNFVLTWNQKINIVSRVETQKNLQHHFVASYVYWDNIKKIKKNLRIVDLGTGGGFPGMVLAIMFPQHHLSLVDSSRKKTLFLKRLSRSLGIQPEILNVRAEELFPMVDEKYDVLVARGFAGLSAISSFAPTGLKKPGQVFVLKGLDYKNQPENKVTNNCIVHEDIIDQRWQDLSYLLKNKIMVRLEY